MVDTGEYKEEKEERKKRCVASLIWTESGREGKNTVTLPEWAGVGWKRIQLHLKIILDQGAFFKANEGSTICGL
jgi:hypothetical protein